MDKARKKTDRMLNDLERRVSNIYDTDPSLNRIRQKYAKYMAKVDDLTKDDYTAYINSPYGENRDALKKAYEDKLTSLTVRNRQYRTLVSEFTMIMAEVNQKALDLINAEMTPIYVINYNQVSEDCKKAGIEVNGQV